jgi:hypothetical protein
MFVSTTFQLILVALLLACLPLSFERRRRAEQTQWLAREREEEAKQQAGRKASPGEASLVAALAPQMEQIRQNYLAARHSRPHDSFYRRGLLAEARQAIMNLSFFSPRKDSA